jgi:hypothetical protein
MHISRCSAVKIGEKSSIRKRDLGRQGKQGGRYLAAETCVQFFAGGDGAAVASRAGMKCPVGGRRVHCRHAMANALVSLAGERPATV